MQRRSASSAGATYLDRDARIGELRRAAAAAQKRLPAIRRVILFGSLVSGIPTPRSDADIVVVVDESPHEHRRDRIPEMLTALSPLPCPIDLFVLTRSEFERYRAEQSPLLRVVESTGIDLL